MVDPRSRFSTRDYRPIGDTRRDNFGIKLLLSQNWGACVYTKIWKKSRKGLESSQDHVSRESIACRSEPADSNAALESAFFRQCQQITTKSTIGVGTRYDGLYKKGKIRVQVILN